MKARFVRTKTKGQSLPIIALIIVVLFAMVGLAVDVGNTYAEQRNAVRASNAAALVGMHTLIVNGHDDQVYKDIVSSLESNNIHVANFGEAAQPGQRVLTARYLDSKGNPVLSCPQVGACGSSTPQGVTYLQVQLDGKVDTYFARIVGTQNLPVGANSFAARGSCTSGVYPIGIRGGDDYLTQDNGFTNPDARYTDTTYRNKTVKIIYTHDKDTPNGGFHWLYWKKDSQSAGNATELRDMVAGPGNLGDGFTEAAWPSSNSASLPKPDVYPTRPNQLNSGDWVAGNSGISASKDVRDALDTHIANRTVMTLPVYDAYAGGGNTVDSSYHVAWLGAFLLVDYDKTGYKWFKVAYLGVANDCASLVSNAPKTTNLGLAGPVYFKPRWRNVPNTRPPVAYTIILDVSGSMSWNFAGQGWNKGAAVQCTGNTSFQCSGPGNPWPNVNERRIKIAKDAINGFIDQMATKDIMRIVAFHGNISNGNDNAALTQLTEVAPSSYLTGSNKAALKSAVTSIGAYNGNSYLTDGGTPSAVGIARANQIVAASSPSNSSGEKYKRVVIFLTDGVANVFRNGTWNNVPGCSSEVASCQTGYTTSSPPVAKPITAMALEAANLKPLLQDTNGALYVIALAGIDETGLKDVASASSYPFFSSAENGADLNGIFADIATDVKYGTCVPQVGKWENTMAPENAANIAPVSAANYPNVGVIYLKNENGTQLISQADIKVDAQTGTLSYSFGEVAPGIYQIQAFVAYTGQDGIGRSYDMIFNKDTQSLDGSTAFQLQASQSLGTVVSKEIRLELDGSVCAQ